MKQYFERMLKQLNENKLSEEDMYQLFQDMVNTGYAWNNPEISLHARMLIEKNCLTTPQGYIHLPITVEEVIEVQKSRLNNQKWVL
jgi:pyrrolidone-carboxylate peptidase